VLDPQKGYRATALSVLRIEVGEERETVRQDLSSLTLSRLGFNTELNRFGKMSIPEPIPSFVISLENIDVVGINDGFAFEDGCTTR